LLFGVFGTFVTFTTLSLLTIGINESGWLKQYKWNNDETELIKEDLILTRAECLLMSSLLGSSDTVAAISLISAEK